ncbi:Glycosyltransferase family 8 protein [Mycena venus]|uniref:Glycosyltransferase family 8 protein n=1 Tax=Mycena venus TaxID=2733690 RepID=A0A8H7D5Z5_9AGAR|nr:Glycosyltransferase family 8 protein [Mycena venus]
MSDYRRTQFPFAQNALDSHIAPNAIQPKSTARNLHRGRVKPSPPSQRAVVSSLYSDGYAITVAALGQSARSTNVSVPLLLPYLEDEISNKALCIGAKDIHHRFHVYLDADTLVLRNFDELFDGPFNFAAVPDVWDAGDPRGFSLMFNAGIFGDTRQKLKIAGYPLQNAEQGFLNLYFGGATLLLPYIHNANLAIKRRSLIIW